MYKNNICNQEIKRRDQEIKRLCDQEIKRLSPMLDKERSKLDSHPFYLNYDPGIYFSKKGSPTCKPSIRRSIVLNKLIIGYESLKNRGEIEPCVITTGLGLNNQNLLNDPYNNPTYLLNNPLHLRFPLQLRYNKNTKLFDQEALEFLNSLEEEVEAGYPPTDFEEVYNLKDRYTQRGDRCKIVVGKADVNLLLSIAQKNHTNVVPKERDFQMAMNHIGISITLNRITPNQDNGFLFYSQKKADTIRLAEKLITFRRNKNSNGSYNHYSGDIELSKWIQPTGLFQKLHNNFKNFSTIHDQGCNRNPYDPNTNWIRYKGKDVLSAVHGEVLAGKLYSSIRKTFQKKEYKLLYFKEFETITIFKSELIFRKVFLNYCNIHDLYVKCKKKSSHLIHQTKFIQHIQHHAASS